MEQRTTEVKLIGNLSKKQGGNKMRKLLLVILLAAVCFALGESNAMANTAGNGDVDGNGVVTARDAQLVYLYTSGRDLKPDQLARADANLNNVVDTIDAQLIFQRALELITLPIVQNPGDVNFNGEVTAGDAQIVYLALTDSKPLTDAQKIVADMNHNGEVDMEDVVLIFNKVLGIE